MLMQIKPLSLPPKTAGCYGYQSCVPLVATKEESGNAQKVQNSAVTFINDKLLVTLKKWS